MHFLRVIFGQIRNRPDKSSFSPFFPSKEVIFACSFPVLEYLETCLFPPLHAMGSFGGRIHKRAPLGSAPHCLRFQRRALLNFGYIAPPFCVTGQRRGRKSEMGSSSSSSSSHPIHEGYCSLCPGKPTESSFLDKWNHQ